MLNVTLPRKPVPPIRKIFRPLKISVGESLAVMIQVCLPLPLGEGRGEGLACYANPTHFLSTHLITSAVTKTNRVFLPSLNPHPNPLPMGEGSMQFTRSLCAVMLQQIGNRIVVLAQRDIERGAGARQGIDICAANQKLLDN